MISSSFPSTKPLSAARAVWIIARLSVRRQVNLWQSVRLARKRQKLSAAPGTQPRSGTPAKSGGRSLLSIFVLLILGVNGTNMGSLGLARLSATSRQVSEASEKIRVSLATRAALVNAEQALLRAREISDPAQREDYVGQWNRYVTDVLLSEVRRGGLSDEEENRRLQEMRDIFSQKGAAGFTQSSRETEWVSGETWPRAAEAGSIFLRAVGLIVLLWVPLILFASLGINSKNLGQVEWSFEWLYTFPVSARILFLSKLFVYSFLNPLVWVFLLPFLVLVYIAGGLGIMALPLGLAAMVYLCILGGALTTVLEVSLRKFLNPSRLKNLQALFTVLATTSLLLIYASSLSKPLDDFLIRRAASLPTALMWNPFSLPLILAMPSAPPRQVQLAVCGMILSLLVFCALALLGSEWLTRDGLIRAGGPYQGRRRISAGSSGTHWLRGIASQEMTLLARDRNLLVQVLIVPLLAPAFYLLIYSGMFSAVSGNFRHAATMAFAVGAYSFLNSAMQLLNREDKTLWFLLSFPHPLFSMLLRKTKIWAGIGLLYGGGVLLVLLRLSRHLHAGALLDALLALYGIGLYAFIAAGIGILATNVFETEARARLRVPLVYLYMILAAMYANIIYSPSLWVKLAQVVLSTVLAVALWQKVGDICPYLLDPVERPPRNLSLADGLIAGLAFFVVQGLMFSLLSWTTELPPSPRLTVAYIIAGLIVSSFTLYILSGQGIIDLYRRIGMIRNLGQSKAHLRSMSYGIALGAMAAAGAFVYLRVLNLVPAWQVWKHDAELSSFLTRAGNPIWLSVLMVVAAPIFEEFLFRGLIFQGLRRTTGPILAVIGSAAIFGLVHPPISVLPVFGLGIATAISFQRSGLLLAPVVTHAVYNACIILFNRA